MEYSIGKMILRNRKKKKISQMELAAMMTAEGHSLTNQAVCKWETELTLPSANQLVALCRIFGIEDLFSELSDGQYGVLSGLNGKGREMAMEYITLLRESEKYAAPIEEGPITGNLRELPLYTIPVSAGNGQFLDSDNYDMVQVGDEVPDSAHFGVRVAGDSMEPKYHDGQKVWVHQQRSLMLGEIGIFIYDGNAYLKQLIAKDDQVALHSLNPIYSDILVSPELQLRVLGKVVS